MLFLCVQQYSSDTGCYCSESRGTASLGNHSSPEKWNERGRRGRGTSLLWKPRLGREITLHAVHSCNHNLTSFPSTSLPPFPPTSLPLFLLWPYLRLTPNTLPGSNGRVCVCMSVVGAASPGDFLSCLPFVEL